MKIKVFFFIVLISLSLSQLSAQSFSKSNLYLKSGYFIPSKESFRENYDQNFFISDLSFPISMGIGLSIPYANALFLNFEIQKIQSQLTSSKLFQINQIPFSLGGKYYFDSIFSNTLIEPYIGANLIFYWSYFSNIYILSDRSGNQIGPVEETDHYFGYGIGLLSGLSMNISDNHFLGIEINYYINNHGTVDNGGLGNIGGLLIAITLGIQL
jgi:hypothetical protein